MLMPKLGEIIRRRPQAQFAPTILLHQHIDHFDSPRGPTVSDVFSKPIEQTPAGRSRNAYALGKLLARAAEKYLYLSIGIARLSQRAAMSKRAQQIIECRADIVRIV
jgi:hypothetical protein